MDWKAVEPNKGQPRKRLGDHADRGTKAWRVGLSVTERWGQELEGGPADLTGGSLRGDCACGQACPVYCCCAGTRWEERVGSRDSADPPEVFVG